jgi:hypothetical protein
MSESDIYEITVVAQDNPFYRKQWFQSTNIDLFIWTDLEKHIIGFDFVYDIRDREKAFLWSHVNGFNHVKVDTNTPKGLLKMSPVYLGEYDCNIDYIMNLCKRECKSLPEDYFDFIYGKMYEYSYRMFD